MKVAIVGRLGATSESAKLEATPRWQFRLSDIAATMGEMRLMVLRQAPAN
jgi:hypothetical protein